MRYFTLPVAGFAVVAIPIWLAPDLVGVGVRRFRTLTSPR